MIANHSKISLVHVLINDFGTIASILSNQPLKRREYIEYNEGQLLVVPAMPIFLSSAKTNHRKKHPIASNPSCWFTHRSESVSSRKSYYGIFRTVLSGRALMRWSLFIGTNFQE
jgi:hypothetical protein